MPPLRFDIACERDFAQPGSRPVAVVTQRNCPGQGRPPLSRRPPPAPDVAEKNTEEAVLRKGVVRREN
jgi:hypothetical protein